MTMAEPKVGDVFRSGNGPEVYTHYRIKKCNLTTGLILLQHRSTKPARPFEQKLCWRGGFWVSIETLRRDFNFVRESAGEE